MTNKELIVSFLGRKYGEDDNAIPIYQEVIDKSLLLLNHLESRNIFQIKEIKPTYDGSICFRGNDYLGYFTIECFDTEYCCLRYGNNVVWSHDDLKGVIDWFLG